MKTDMDELIKANKGLAYHWAKYFKRPGITMDELVAVGMEGLWKAGQKYDATKGASFANYSSLWIKHYMRRYVKKQSVVTTPFAKPTNYYFEELDENQEEMMQSPLDSAISSEQVEMLQEALSKLTPKERQVLAWRHEKDMTFVEIAAEIGCARESARMLYNSALLTVKQVIDPEAE